MQVVRRGRLRFEFCMLEKVVRRGRGWVQPGVNFWSRPLPVAIIPTNQSTPRPLSVAIILTNQNRPHPLTVVTSLPVAHEPCYTTWGGGSDSQE